MNNNTTDSTGERLRSVRGTRTQADFSAALGIGRTTLIRYESNARQPDADLLRRLWEAFKVDPLWLLSGVNATAPDGVTSADEQRLLRLFRACRPAARDHLMASAELLAGHIGNLTPTAGADSESR